MLSSEMHSHKTIIEIAYAVGYNSKSSFNSAFRRWAQTTPSEFRDLGRAA